MGPNVQRILGRCLNDGRCFPPLPSLHLFWKPLPQLPLAPRSWLCFLLCAHPHICGLGWGWRVFSHLPPPLDQKSQVVLDCLPEPCDQPQSLALSLEPRRASPICCLKADNLWVVTSREKGNEGAVTVFHPYKEELYFCWDSVCARDSSKLFR